MTLNGKINLLNAKPFMENNMHFGNLDNYRIGDSIIHKETVRDSCQKCENLEADDPVNNLIYGEVTVPIKVKGVRELMWVESSIAPHIYLLNELGYKTLSCCAGHKKYYFSRCDNNYVSNGFIEVTHDAMKRIIEQFSGDKTTFLSLHDVVDLSDSHMTSSVKVHEYDNSDCFSTGLIEWNVAIDKNAYENGESSTDLSKLFEYALYQMRQWVFRNIILELKRIA